MDYIQNSNDIAINTEKNRNNREIGINNNEITIHVTLQKNIIRLKSYHVGKFLGNGINSKCYEFISDEDVVRHSYACKIINKENFKEHKIINKEIKNLESLYTSNIVKLK